MSALHVPLGWHARGDHAEVELDDDRNVVLDLTRGPLHDDEQEAQR